MLAAIRSIREQQPGSEKSGAHAAFSAPCAEDAGPGSTQSVAEFAVFIARPRMSMPVIVRRPPSYVFVNSSRRGDDAQRLALSPSGAGATTAQADASPPRRRIESTAPRHSI